MENPSLPRKTWHQYICFCLYLLRSHMAHMALILLPSSHSNSTTCIAKAFHKDLQNNDSYLSLFFGYFQDLNAVAPHPVNLTLGLHPYTDAPETSNGSTACLQHCMGVVLISQNQENNIHSQLANVMGYRAHMFTLTPLWTYGDDPEGKLHRLVIWKEHSLLCVKSVQVGEELTPLLLPKVIHHTISLSW